MKLKAALEWVVTTRLPVAVRVAGKNISAASHFHNAVKTGSVEIRSD